MFHVYKSGKENLGVENKLIIVYKLQFFDQVLADANAVELEILKLLPFVQVQILLSNLNNV